MAVPEPLREDRNLQFLKLGGSLITEKSQPHTARHATLARLAGEITAARIETPELRLILGHGSGSFGHVPAQKYGTLSGVKTDQDWHGFIEVWREASALNRLVMEALQAAGIPAIGFPPSACVTADDGRVAAWDLNPLRRALDAGLLPVVYGDTVFDRRRRGTILSTEDLFVYLTGKFRPGRWLLAGIEPGVWADYPACTRLVEEITPQRWQALSASIQGSAATDVTGGMASKVALSLQLAAQYPPLEVQIFSGESPDEVRAALLGANSGTRICAGL